MSLLEVSELTKSFGGLRAVDTLSFSLDEGEILGLVGPNGSGKSTTMGLIMGIIRAQSGSVRFRGNEITRLPTHRISARGVGIVFQHSRPLRRQSVVENIELALLPDRITSLLPHPSLRRRARAVAERVGLGAVADRHPETLSFADVRRMELAKTMALEPHVVLLDEPFAGLTGEEIKEFSRLIASLRDEGRAIVLVDHNVKSVRALVDRMLVMYVGRKIAEGQPDEVLNDSQVREVYLGGSLDSEHAPSARSTARRQKPLLEVRGMSVHYGKARALHDVTFAVHQGEFVSIVGINGAGKTTLFNAISGFLSYRGEVRWQDRPLLQLGGGASARAGIVHCPEGRELFGDMSVRENLDLGGHDLSKERLAAQKEWIFGLFPILAERLTQTARTLSGGEQQMLAIARALMMRPRLLILDEPTLGLAPLVLEHISQAMEALRKESGLTVLLGEQNVTFALRHAEHIYLLENGEIHWQGDAPSFVAEVGERYL